MHLYAQIARMRSLKSSLFRPRNATRQFAARGTIFSLRTRRSGGRVQARRAALSRSSWNVPFIATPRDDEASIYTEWEGRKLGQPGCSGPSNVYTTCVGSRSTLPGDANFRLCVPGLFMNTRRHIALSYLVWRETQMGEIFFLVSCGPAKLLGWRVSRRYSGDFRQEGNVLGAEIVCSYLFVSKVVKWRNLYSIPATKGCISLGNVHCLLFHEQIMYFCFNFCGMVDEKMVKERTPQLFGSRIIRCLFKRKLFSFYVCTMYTHNYTTSLLSLQIWFSSKGVRKDALRSSQKC